MKKVKGSEYFLKIKQTAPLNVRRRCMFLLGGQTFFAFPLISVEGGRLLSLWDTSRTFLLRHADIQLVRISSQVHFFHNTYALHMTLVLVRSAILLDERPRPCPGTDQRAKKITGAFEACWGLVKYLNIKWKIHVGVSQDCIEFDKYWDLFTECRDFSLGPYCMSILYVTDQQSTGSQTWLLEILAQY